MSRQIQIRRGTAAEHENFTGAIGEITMDTTSKTLRLHDGETAGGIKLASASPQDSADYVTETQLPTAENNYTWYRKYKSGWVEMGGYGTFNTVITLPVTMCNSGYTVNATAMGAIGSSGIWASEKTQTTIRIIGQNNGGQSLSSAIALSWLVFGEAA